MVPTSIAIFLLRSPSKIVKGLGSAGSFSVESLVLLVSIYWLISANRPFVGVALRDRNLGEPSTWLFAGAMVVLVLAIHALVLLLVSNRWTVKPVLAVMIVAAAAAGFYMDAYGVYVDPSMMRNTLRTDVAEASELLTPRMVLHMALYAGIPLLLLWRVRVQTRPWLPSLGRRLLWIAGALMALVLAVMSVFQPFASLMRNNKDLRYLITPANAVWSTGAVLASDLRGAKQPRQAIGLDAKPGPSWAGISKPRVVIVVVGETARAANWGLNGYARQTTPRLSQMGVINFPDVSACGTNTEVSVPCMFAPVGRRDYDESRIRGQDSLLHVAARAGAGVHWRDNQSGCKGVCDGLPNELVSAERYPGWCADGRCLDESLTHDLDKRLEQLLTSATPPPPQLWVLHMLGNHGPSYFRRYPPAFARFQPECRSDDLRKCSIPEIVNAYDNALLYTDHVIADAIERLKAHADRVDASLIYVSDHGESLGEKGLFLHGIPYAIAPAEQTRVPMVLWASGGFEAAAGYQAGCLTSELQRQAQKPRSHDNLFHTVLGLLDIQTSLHEASLDVTAACRRLQP